MKSNFFQNSLVREMILRSYREWAKIQFWRSGPRVLINSIPKAGTHLLIAELQKFLELSYSRLHLDHSNVIRGGLEGRSESLSSEDVEWVRLNKELASLRPGQYCTAHLAYIPEFSSLLTQRNIKILNLIRDPLDIMVSNFYYLNGLRRHRIHDFFCNKSREDQYKAIIFGHHSNPRIVPQNSILKEYLGWAQDATVLTVRFEDLIGDVGGGSDLIKAATVDRIRKHVGLEGKTPATVHKSTTSVTFRQGKIGGWRSELEPSIVRMFEDACGKVARDMGYHSNSTPKHLQRQSAS